MNKEPPALRTPDHSPGTARLDLFLRKLLSHSLLSTEDQRLLAALPFEIRRIEPNAYILHEGDLPKICPIILSGYAFRQKHVSDGGRQIVAIKFPGDALDFQSLYLDTADHSIQALTEVTLALVAIADLEALTITRPSIARAVLVDILIEASIGREWILNIGRRNALERLAHFLCEFVHRSQTTQPELGDSIALPMTQEQLADLLGLTPVHVNRTLKLLEEAGAVTRRHRRVRTASYAELCRIAGFSPLYLHRDNSSM